MVNAELTDIFSRIADLLEIQGEDAFRVNSYRRVARSLEGVTEDVAVLAADGRLKDVPGVGKSTAEKIAEYLETGTIALYDELKAAVPKGLPALLDIPGLGPKKVRAVWQELRVESVDDLKAAIESGALAKLSGFGAKSVENIREGLEFLDRSAGRTPLGVALPIALEVAGQLKAATGIEHVEVAGSIRRGRETIGDVDLLCVGDDGPKIIKAFTTLPASRGVRAAGDTKGSILVPRPDGGELQIDLRVVPAASYGAALLYFTGSKEHNVRIRERAAKKGWKLNEYGLFDGERSIAGKDEAAIYRKLGLPWLPPEVREDRGELDRTDALDGLVALDDIRGDLHMHSTASDGRNSIEEMAAAAKQRGYAYIAICDHSRSSAVAGGLSIDELLAQIEQIRRINEKLKGITVLAGTECDILANGSLDFPDDVLAQCDVVIASIHSALRGDRAKVTDRTIKAMQNPHVTAIGHATGRLIGRREAMDLDIDAVVEAAVATGTALEINASWQRLDLKDVHAERAVAAGAMLVINTDAHSTDQLDMMDYGIRTARRGWVPREAVMNTRPLAALRKLIAKKRK